jgi:hypothetical protein
MTKVFGTTYVFMFLAAVYLARKRPESTSAGRLRAAKNVLTAGVEIRTWPALGLWEKAAKIHCRLHNIFDCSAHRQKYRQWSELAAAWPVVSPEER